jgi:uncharacterized repeat protein (TIGR01451 family)
MPHSFTIGTGRITQTHPKPAEGGYTTNWDPYAVSLELTPVVDVNTVNEQHILIATVKDKNGKPLENRRVEWILADGGVGAFVEVDESGWREARGYKVDNTFAVTHTNNFKHTLTRGNEDPSDDIKLGKGQTWAVITSPIEGTSNVIAYAPGIYDWDKHKAFAKKHWYDVKWVIPKPAVNPVGTPHPLKTRVLRASDGGPLKGYEVRYEILDGPPASFDPGGQQVVTVATDGSGIAAVTLNQKAPKEGINKIGIEVIRVPCDECDERVLVARGATIKEWIGPKIAIQKRAPAMAVKGESFKYNIMVRNPSEVPATNVRVTDKLPDGIAYVSSSPSASVRGQTLSWQLGQMGPSSSKNIEITVKANRVGRFTNCANVTADMGLQAKDCANTQVVEPKINISKEGPKEVMLCDPIRYVITVSNPGDAPAEKVTVTDRLPSGLVSKDGSRVITRNIGTLGAGQRKVIEFEVNAEKKGVFRNTASVTAAGGLKDDATVTTKVVQPVLVISKKGPSKRYIGRPVNYEITVTNKGDGAARNTVLVDELPSGADFVGASNGGKVSGGKITWNLGTLQPNASKKVTINLKAKRAGTLRNRAKATAYCAEASDEIETAVEGIPAILLECIDLEDPIEVGSRVTYVITVTNQGSAVGTNITLNCTLPPEEEFVSAAGPTKEQVSGKRRIKFAPLKSLAPKASATYRLVVKGVKAGDVRFKVSMKSDQMSTPAAETEATRIYGE